MKNLRISLVLASVLLTSCGVKLDTVHVTSSIFPHFDAVRAITRNTDIKFSLIVPPGVEVHSYTPTPQQTRQIHDSDLFFYSSDSIETWASKMSFKSTEVINIHEALFDDDDADHDHKHDHEHDEHGHEHGAHFWTNPHNYIEEINLVTTVLSEKYPTFADEFMVNRLTYTQAIEEIAQSFKDYLSSVDTPQIYFVGHNAMHDFGDFFGLNITALVDDIKPDAEATAKELAALTDAIIKSNTQVIFIEELVSPSFAYTLVNELKSKHNRDLKIYELHGYHNLSDQDYKNNVTYLDLLSRNITYIKEAIQ